VLRREAGRDLDLWRLLASSPPFCIALMLEGALALGWSAADTNLDAAFVWAAALLAGIAAMTGNHIRGFTRCPRSIPLTESARELRLLLFYTGFAWGLGALLILSPAPLWAALVFAAAPSLTTALVLKCEKSVIAFATPASLLSAAAVFWNGQPQTAWAAGTILMAGVSIAGFSMLQCAMRTRQDLH
jgi:hypothetical protein